MINNISGLKRRKKYINTLLETCKSPTKKFNGVKFVRVEPGSFLTDKSNTTSEFTQHNLYKVVVPKGFYIQLSPVTVGQWRLFADYGYKTEAELDGWAWCHAKKGWKIPGVIPGLTWLKKKGVNWEKPGFRQTDDHPVTCISWNDAQEYIKWISRKEKSYYRLPTEAEWEYCCRADTSTPYAFGDDISNKFANIKPDNRFGAWKDYLYKAITNKRTTISGEYPPNAWGIFDMHGNVWEWCNDLCESEITKKQYASGKKYDNAVNPISKNGTKRILRGGSWYYDKLYCGSSHRRFLEAESKVSAIGFRLVLEMSNQQNV